MEVKPGYRKTEVGVIPEKWDVKRLGELGAVVRGGSPRPAGDPKITSMAILPPGLRSQHSRISPRISFG